MNRQPFPKEVTLKIKFYTDEEFEQTMRSFRADASQRIIWNGCDVHGAYEQIFIQLKEALGECNENRK